MKAILLDANFMSPQAQFVIELSRSWSWQITMVLLAFIFRRPFSELLISLKVRGFRGRIGIAEFAAEPVSKIPSEQEREK